MEEDEPLYYRLIKAFFKLTGVPMVLNTSFNTIKSEVRSLYLLYWNKSTNTGARERSVQPIPETPADAARSFLHAVCLLYWYKSKNTDATSAQPITETPAEAVRSILSLVALLVQQYKY